MPPPMYQDANASTSANGEQLLPEHPSHSSLSPPLSVADHHDQTLPLMRMHMPEPETVQMAQLPRGRIEPEQLPTPFVSPYEGSVAVTPASSEGTGHAREHIGTGASRSSAAQPEASHRGGGGGGEGIHDGGAGADEPPPPYTLTA